MGVCAAVTIYFTYATIVLVPQDVGGVTLTFWDYGMIQFYIFMSVVAFLLYMFAGGSK